MTQRPATPRNQPTLVLASGSATRLRVLRDAGLDPEVVVSGVDETADPALGTPALVRLLAERKATAVAAHRPDALVLGCDSMLELDDASIGKPASAGQAEALWRRLSGRAATLYTGHCLIAPGGGQVSDVAGALVRFGTPSAAEVAAYAASGEPMRMAGGFSIDGLAGPFIDGVDGSPSTVLGLSLPLLRRLLAGLGLAITDLWRVPG
jgi:septum formation protein